MYVSSANGNIDKVFVSLGPHLVRFRLYHLGATRECLARGKKDGAQHDDDKTHSGFVTL